MRKSTKAKIHFESLDRRLLYLICEEDARPGLMQTFQTAGFSVQYLKNFNDLYSHLESGLLGFVLVSRSIQEAFGETHLAGFIQRRFRVPIISFSAKQEKDERLSGSAEIMHLTGGMNPDDILHTLTSFETDYQKGPKPAEPRSKLDELVSGLDKMITPTPLKIDLEQNVKVLGLRAKSGDEHVILLCAIPLPAPSIKEEGLKSSLKKLLKERYPDATVSQAEIFDSLTLKEYERLAGNADSHWQGMMGPVECLVSLSAETSAQEKAAEHPAGRLIPIEDWMTANNLAFPVYHWLERNQKTVRYARAGGKVDSAYIERFQQRGILYLLIQENDLDRYEIIRQLLSRNPAA